MWTRGRGLKNPKILRMSLMVAPREVRESEMYLREREGRGYTLDFDFPTLE